jgi:hypothetical protein
VEIVYSLLRCIFLYFVAVVLRVDVDYMSDYQCLRVSTLYNDWLIMKRWDCLITADTNGPIAHPPGDTWAWRAMVMMMPAGDNSWLVHSSLEVLPAEASGASRRNGRRSENFAYQYLKHLKGSVRCGKILRHGTSGFTSHPKEGVLRIFIVLKNPSPRLGFIPWPLGPVASTLTTTPPRRLLHIGRFYCYYSCFYNNTNNNNSNNFRQ